MAKGKFTGGRPFEKGVSGNPKGRPPLPADLKATRDMDQMEFERLARGMMQLTKKELNDLIKAEDSPAQVVMIARIVRAGMWSSDQKRLDFLMTRLVGRPKNHSAKDDEKEKAATSFIDLVLQAEQAKRDGQS